MRKKIKCQIIIFSILWEVWLKVSAFYEKKTVWFVCFFAFAKTPKRLWKYVSPNQNIVYPLIEISGTKRLMKIIVLFTLLYSCNFFKSMDFLLFSKNKNHEKDWATKPNKTWKPVSCILCMYYSWHVSMNDAGLWEMWRRLGTTKSMQHFGQESNQVLV